MKPIRDSWFCQIEVNNICPLDCAYCSRYIRHLRPDQRYNIKIDVFRQAVQSLDGFKGDIGLIGGEPTLHPQFRDLCSILKDELKIPRDRLGLWTSGGRKFDELKSVINQTFGMLAYNEHNPEQEKVCRHQPLTIAIQDVVSDEDYMWELIDNCWVQRQWCPSINPKGAFFCEVAGALDILLDGPGGWPLEARWWDKDPAEFRDQVERYCPYCGMAIPIERELLSSQREKISWPNLLLFREHNLRRISRKDVELFDRQLTVEEMEAFKPLWDPGNYREDIRTDRRQGWSAKQERRKHETAVGR